MHKSKYFDKAGEMAISKLMPKPDISISINMAGGGGLSSISKPIMINRQGGGPSRHVNTLDVLGYGSPDEYRPYRHYLNKLPNYAKQYIKGMKNKALYETTGLKYSDTTEEDLTEKEAEALKEGIAYGVMSGKDKFANIGTSFEDWGQLGKDTEHLTDIAPKNTRTEAEALVGGASVSWNPETGKYEFIDPYDFEKYGGHEGLPGAYKGRMFKSNKLFGIPLALGNILVGRGDQGSPYPGAFKTRIGLTPQKVQDISEKNNFFGVEDRNLSGLEGYSEEIKDGVTTSFIDDMAIDTTSGLKHGGQTMSGGLSGINKTMMIKGQPHKLAWIRPDEASVLKAMGGSGKKVGGIPAYFYIGEDESYEDVVVDSTGESPTEEYYMGVPSEHLTDISPSEPAKDIDKREPQIYSPEHTPRETAQQISRRLLGDGPEDGVDRYLYPYWNELKDRGLTNQQVADRLAAVMSTPAGLMGLQKGYYEGYTGWGPMGTLERLTDNMGQQYAEAMKKYMEEDKTRKGLKADYQLEEEETQNIFSSALGKLKDVFMGPDELTPDAIRDIQADFKERGATFTPMSGMERGIGAVLQPTIFKIFSSIVGGRPIGTLTTKEGLTYTVGEGGEITYQDSPVAVDEGNEPRKRIQRKRAVPKVEEKVEETESFPTGRRIASLGGLQDIYQNIYDRKFRTG